MLSCSKILDLNNTSINSHRQLWMLSLVSRHVERCVETKSTCKKNNFHQQIRPCPRSSCRSQNSSLAQNPETLKSNPNRILIIQNSRHEFVWEESSYSTPVAPLPEGHQATYPGRAVQPLATFATQMNWANEGVHWGLNDTVTLHVLFVIHI